MSEQSFVILWNPWVMQSGKKIAVRASSWTPFYGSCRRDVAQGTLRILPSPRPLTFHWKRLRNERKQMRFKHYDIDMVMKEANVWSVSRKSNPTWIWQGKKSHLDLKRKKVAPGFGQVWNIVLPQLRLAMPAPHSANLDNISTSRELFQTQTLSSPLPETLFKKSFSYKDDI